MQKNKYILFGIAAGLCFLVVYVVGKNFLLSLLISGLLFLILALIFRRSKGQVDAILPQSAPELLQVGIVKAQGEVVVIRQNLLYISDQQLVAVARRLCDVSDRIIIEAKEEKQVDDFFAYYLPVVRKVIEKYVSIERNQLNTPDSLAFKQKASTFLSELEPAFIKQLEALFHNEMVDLSLEMQVMKTTLKTEGLLSDPLGKEGTL